MVMLEELGLKREFLENEQSRIAMKNLDALGFVKLEDVPIVFDKIKSDAPAAVQGK
ncbi:unnamed protein product, partial [Didymodactylos carnosus]